MFRLARENHLSRFQEGTVADEHHNAKSPAVEPGSFVSSYVRCPAILLDSVLVKAQPKNNRIANAKRSVFQSNLSTGTLLSVPFPRSEACRAKGNRMRTLVQPPPSTHCDLCGGELLFKLVEPANRILDLEYEIFVCENCRREQSCIVANDKYARYAAH